MCRWFYLFINLFGSLREWGLWVGKGEEDDDLVDVSWKFCNFIMLCGIFGFVWMVFMVFEWCLNGVYVVNL